MTEQTPAEAFAAFLTAATTSTTSKSEPTDFEPAEPVSRIPRADPTQGATGTHHRPAANPLSRLAAGYRPDNDGRGMWRDLNDLI